MRYYVFSILCALSMYARAQNNQELFLHGNELFGQGEYQQALEKYQTITRPGYGTYAHMAHAFERLGRDVDALVYFTKAYYMATGSDARELAHAVQTLRAQLNVHDSPTVCERVYHMSKTFPMALWQIILIVVSWMVCAALIYMQRRWICAGMIGLLMAYSGFIYCAYYESRMQRAVMIVDAPVYSGKDIRLITGKIVDKGHEVVVTSRNDEWYKIKNNGVTGWVERDTCTLI